MNDAKSPRIGVAGWSVPSGAAGALAKPGSQLQRYSAQFACVEINSSFYRPHRPQTYARWAATVPDGFRFAVKAPRMLTHEARLRDAQPLLEAFLEQAGALGKALGPILIQLPPSLPYEQLVADAFLRDLRRLFAGEAVIEPRHAAWFATDADRLLASYGVGRVGADPALCPEAAMPGGSAHVRYWRLHGSPRMYHTAYGEDRLRELASRLAPSDWCIFDNTASGAALADAMILQRLMAS